MGRSNRHRRRHNASVNEWGRWEKWRESDDARSLQVLSSWQFAGYKTCTLLQIHNAAYEHCWMEYPWSSTTLTPSDRQMRRYQCYLAYCCKTIDAELELYAKGELSFFSIVDLKANKATLDEALADQVADLLLDRPVKDVR